MPAACSPCVTRSRRSSTRRRGWPPSRGSTSAWASVPGFGLVSCAELAGEIGNHQRFGREASLALYLGATSLDHSSGQQQGSKTARHVNRRAKAALMNAVDHHRKQVPASLAYYEKKRAHGKTHNQAIRALARHFVRVLWSMFVHDRDYERRENTAKAACKFQRDGRTGALPDSSRFWAEPRPESDLRPPISTQEWAVERALASAGGSPRVPDPTRRPLTTS